MCNYPFSASPLPFIRFVLAHFSAHMSAKLGSEGLWKVSWTQLAHWHGWSSVAEPRICFVLSSLVGALPGHTDIYFLPLTPAPSAKAACPVTRPCPRDSFLLAQQLPTSSQPQPSPDHPSGCKLDLLSVWTSLKFPPPLSSPAIFGILYHIVTLLS